MEVMGQILIAALAGGVIGLDRTAAGQFMISQPIVAGPLTGLILGDVMAGLIIGALLELIWVMDVPVGTFVPANATVAAVSATAIAAIGTEGAASLGVVGFALLLTVAMAPLTMPVEAAVRKRNARLGAAFFASSGRPAASALGRAHLPGLFFFFAKSFLLCLVIVPMGLLALEGFERLPAAFTEAMELFVKLLPLLGITAIARRLSVRLIDRFLAAGFLLAAVLGAVFTQPAAAVIPLAIAAGWLGVKYHA